MSEDTKTSLKPATIHHESPGMDVHEFTSKEEAVAAAVAKPNRAEVTFIFADDGEGIMFFPHRYEVGTPSEEVIALAEQMRVYGIAMIRMLGNAPKKEA